MVRLRKIKHESKSAGLTYIMLVCCMTCLLLIVNFYLVGIFLHVNRNWIFGRIPDIQVQFRFFQAFQFVLPVILTMFQFWVFDRFLDRAFGYGSKTPD